jgi:hypothetical protein
MPQPKQKTKSAKPPSPKKARSVPNMRENFKHKKEKPIPTICVHSFRDPFAIEAYEYTLMATKPGFINKYRMWSRGEVEVEELTDANFVGIKIQRDNDNPGNEPLLDKDGYSCVWLIRYPKEDESTAETREVGLGVLKAFFMSRKGTDYPPLVIKTVDATPEIPKVLEKYFLDNNIEEIIKQTFDITELKEEFYDKFTTVANSIYLEKEPSDYAKEHLGFSPLA